MRRSNLELWAAFFTMAVVGGGYVFVVSATDEVPAAGEWLGHVLGAVGFLLMLMTETLYSLRKRSRRARWGRMASWLRFHIFTGLVGPFLVLLHTSWKFGGIAGVVSLLTLVVVLSGVVGRYIYTAIPRTASGAEVQAAELTARIAAADAQIEEWRAARPELATALAERLTEPPDAPGKGIAVILRRRRAERDLRRSWERAQSRVDARFRAELAQVEDWVRRRRMLRRQIDSLATARRLLAGWHAVHIPIGMALFTAAFIHIGGALYYATLSS